MEDPILFAAAVLAILCTPGPTNTLLATAGATRGFWRSLPLVPAEAAGYAISILTLGLLLGPAIASAPLVGAALRAAVGVYLLLLAIGLWRRGGVALSAGAAVTPSQVFVTTLLNPKAIVFALGVVPFTAPRPWLYLLGFNALLVLVASCWIAAGALLGRAASNRGWATAVPRVGAAVVGSFAVLLIMAPLLR